MERVLGWWTGLLDRFEEVNWPLLLVSVLAVIQFLYLDVSVEIASLPRLIVFVLVGGQPPG